MIRTLFNIILFILFYFSTFAQFPIDGFKLNPEGGIHPGLEKINIEIEEGVRVYYTKDSFPVNRGSNRIYSSRDLKIRGNTVFEFLVIDTLGEKHTFSQSYIVDREHSLPVLSIVSNPNHFFDSLTGIYVKGCCADTVDPYFGANFWKKWEREINVEYYNEEGKLGFNQPCGVRIFGGYSKSMPQKSLALFARKKYGDNRFRYPIYKGRDLKKYKNIVLRNGGGDMLGAHIRDVYATQLVKETGLLIQEYQPVAVYINGQYWGKYNLREKINEHFIKAHFGYPKDSLIIMRHNGDHQHGPPGDYRKFIKNLKKLDLSKPEDLKYVDKKIDIDNYITYNIAQIYTGNGDAGGNIRYYKSMRDTAKWRWIFYDLDHAMNVNSSKDYLHNSLIDFTTYKDERWPNPPWSTLIIRKLFENDSIKNFYINRYLDLVNTTFKKERALGLLEKLEKEVEEEIDYHLKRWKVTRKRYDKSFNDIRIFAEKRPQKLIEHLDERFELGETYHLKIVCDDPTKGHVQLNSLKLDSNFYGTYYKNHAVRLTAYPRFDYEFKGWEGIDDKKESVLLKSKEDTLVVKPTFKRKPYSNWRNNITISAIDAVQENEAKDWVEIYNLSKDTIDVSNFELRDDEDEHVFIFPSNSFIYPDSSLVICENLESFCEVYNCDSLSVIGSFGFGIGKKSDWVRIYDNENQLIDFINLEKFDKVEKESQVWTKKDYRNVKFSVENWELSYKQPGEKGGHYSNILEEEKKDERNRLIFYFTGIGAGTLAIILFFIFFVRQYFK